MELSTVITSRRTGALTKEGNAISLAIWPDRSIQLKQCGYLFYEIRGRVTVDFEEGSEDDDPIVQSVTLLSDGTKLVTFPKTTDYLGK